jgi:hypothetical protein
MENTTIIQIACKFTEDIGINSVADYDLDFDGTVEACKDFIPEKDHDNFETRILEYMDL